MGRCTTIRPSSNIKHCFTPYLYTTYDVTRALHSDCAPKIRRAQNDFGEAFVQILCSRYNPSAAACHGSGDETKYRNHTPARTHRARTDRLPHQTHTRTRGPPSPHKHTYAHADTPPPPPHFHTCTHVMHAQHVVDAHCLRSRYSSLTAIAKRGKRTCLHLWAEESSRTTILYRTRHMQLSLFAIQ